MDISISKKLKVLALCNGRCFYCGIELDDKNRTIDHKIAKDNGGKNAIENLLPCCRSCNSSKHTKDIESFRKWFGRKKQGIPNFTTEQEKWLIINGFTKHIPEHELFYGEK